MTTVRLKARILVPSVLASALVLATFVFGAYHEEREHLTEDFARSVQAVQGHYRTVLEERARKLEAALEALVEDPALRTALAARDRGALLARTQPLFQRLEAGYEITHLYFHDPQRVNLLRVHQPERYGDRIERFTALAAERSGKMAHGVELGPLGTFTLRAVAPVREGPRLLGYLELGEEVDRLIHDMQTVLGVELVVAIDKRYLNRADWEGGMRMLGRAADWERFPAAVVVSQTLPAIPDSLAAALARSPGGYPVDTIDVPWEDRRYLARFVPLQDAGQRTVGSLVILRDMTARFQGNTATLLTLSAGVVTLGALLFAFFYFILDRAERTLAASQRGLRDSEARLANAQHLARLGNWEWDIARDTLRCSQEVGRLLGLERGRCPAHYEELLGFVHPADKEVFARFIERVRADGGTHDLEHRLVRPDGSQCAVRHRAEAVRDAAGQVCGINATLLDVTERQRAEMLSFRLGRILEHSWNEIYAFDAATLRFVQASDGACRNLGYTPEELQRLTPLDLKTEFTPEQFAALLEPLRRGEKPQVAFESTHRRKDGSVYPVEVRLQLSSAETPPVFVAIIQDISERKRYIAELEHKALYDALTELPNRGLFADRLRQVLAAARRETRPLAVMLLDVARMKEVNDVMGYQSGDRVLREVAARLKQGLRASDTVARMGGDEFAMVLTGVGGEHAAATAAKIQKAFEPPVVIEDMPLEIEAAIGIALYPDHGDEADVLLQHADIAMREAKNEKTSFSLYDPHRDPYSRRRLKLLGELRQAINDKRLVLYYQPKVDAATGRVSGVEALARWPHPTEGLISPVDFIPMMEQSGLIRPFTLWVLEQAIGQCGRWAEAGIDLTVAVNLSTRNLLDPSLPEEIARLLETHQVKPGCLVLEITETAIMSRPESALKILRRLDAMGLKIAIDDFGTGYSSLAYLKKLPVAELKIDASFVAGMTGDANDSAIVRATIDLAHNLGLKVVAEGVEHAAAWDRLVALGCDVGQGYFFSSPVPPGEIARFISEGETLSEQG